MTTQTWIITGASRGFGRALAESALAAVEYKITTYGGSTGPDVQALGTTTGTDRTALPDEPLRRALPAE